MAGVIAWLSGCPNLFCEHTGNDSQTGNDAESYTVTYEANGAARGTSRDDQTEI